MTARGISEYIKELRAEISTLKRELEEIKATYETCHASRMHAEDVVRRLERELKEASGDAAILAHAYGTDNRPPTNVVVRSIERGKMALENKPLNRRLASLKK